MTHYEKLIDAVANHLLELYSTKYESKTKDKLVEAWKAAKEDREMMDAAIKQTNGEVESGTAITPIELMSDKEIDEFFR